MSNLDQRRESPRKEPPDWPVGAAIGVFLILLGLASFAISFAISSMVEPRSCVRIANAIVIAGRCP